MVKLFARMFIKNSDQLENKKVRSAYGTMCAVFGIITNLIICAGKVIIGLLIQSISIISDGINNLTDSASSIITLVGFKLAIKPADEKHPYGHERIEYINSLIISMIILVIGVSLAYSSIGKIINPVSQDLSFFLLGVIILGASILIKVWQSIFYSKTAKLIDSIALKATSQDALSDILSTSVVLVSLIISRFSGLVIDGYIGVAVAILIIVNAIKLIIEATSPIIGEAPDEEFVKKVSEKIESYDGVLGIHDFVIHSYGASKTFITVHVEVDNTIDINISHDLIDQIEHDFMEQYDIHMVIHMDPVDVINPIVIEAKEKIKEIIESISKDLMFHDFRMVIGESHSNLIFDVVVPFKFSMNQEEIKDAIQKKVKEFNPKYFIVINFDIKYA